MEKKGPTPIGTVVADILARKGLGRQQATIELNTIWENVVGDALAQISRCGQVRRNKLHVVVTNSTAMQELTFKKHEILEKLNQHLPNHLVADIHFRIGKISDK